MQKTNFVHYPKCRIADPEENKWPYRLVNIMEQLKDAYYHERFIDLVIAGLDGISADKSIRKEETYLTLVRLYKHARAKRHGYRKAAAKGYVAEYSFNDEYDYWVNHYNEISDTLNMMNQGVKKPYGVKREKISIDEDE